MSDSKKVTWFPAKKNGWGWGKPNTWQGWLVWSLYMFVVIAISFIFDPKETLIQWSIWVGISTFLLLLIYYIKGESPSWKWKRIERKKHKLFK
ncbi:hypothetical protein [Marinomonas transparens]|uniref:Uncharacterized protein n=1 Tax=Marinomonas transparens TaxID=2795388 RepID=A0A934JME8_9GAMM|nr:hypothetical protein [Marinomonas transparens]MBJ7536699.1 hypothetical protein [Marinomonas transparens]